MMVRGNCSRIKHSINPDGQLGWQRSMAFLKNIQVQRYRLGQANFNTFGGRLRM